MICVLSDLHFQDVRLEPDGVRVDPNVPAESLERFFRGMARRIEDDIRAGRKVKECTFVLAGDIFELHRTERWFSYDLQQGNPENLRPYSFATPLNLRAPNERALDAVVARILGGILHEDGSPLPQKPAPASVAVPAPVSLLLGGSAPQTPVGAGERVEPEKAVVIQGKLTPAMQAIRDAWKDPARYGFPVPVRFAYLPGNHDRLVNLSPTAARAIRELLGMGSDGAVATWRFPHRLVDPKHGVAIRHGHEYDATNCEFFLGRPKSVLTEDLYDRATIGDLITLDVAGRLPHLFRAQYENAVDPDHEDGRLYKRIREVDDLRPIGAIVDWILYSVEEGSAAFADGGKKLWKDKLTPILTSVVMELSRNSFLTDWLSRHDKKGADRVDMIQAALSRPSFRALGRMTIGSAGVIRMILKAATADRDAGRLGPTSLPDFEKMLKHELSLGSEVDPKDEKFLSFLVSGHTHNPGIEPLRSVSRDGREMFSIDTGTWRRLIRRCRDGRTFATTRMATYAIFYADDEGPGHRFQVWTGVTAGGDV